MKKEHKMKNKTILYMLILISPLLTQCKSTEIVTTSKPIILKVNTTLIESSKGIKENEATSIIEFKIHFDHTENIEEISSIIIESPERSKWSFIQKEFNKLNKNNGYIDFRTITSSKHKHYIPLGEYKITINYSRYEPYTYTFDVYGRGDPSLNTGRIYTEALNEEPQILTTPVDFNAKIIGNDLILSFKSTDELINNGSLRFYDENSDYIYEEVRFSDAKPIISVGNNEYTFDVTNNKENIKSLELVLWSDTNTVNDKTIYWCMTGKFPVESDYIPLKNEMINGPSTSSDHNENIIWDKVIRGSNESIYFSDIAMDKNENVYVVGSGMNLKNADSDSDWIIKKFDKNGIEDKNNWNKVFDGNNGYDHISSLYIDNKQDIYISGYGENIISDNSGSDLWIKKLNSDGVEDLTNWNKKITLNSNSIMV